jgi:hypothetical protein
MNNEDNGNPQIWRFNSQTWAVVWYNQDLTLGALHTTYPVPTGCGATGPVEPMDIQEVRRLDQADMERFIRNVQNNSIRIIVGDVTTPGSCFGFTMVAHGTGFIRSTDSDYDPYPEQKNANAWGFRAHGALTSPAGGTVMYNGHFNCVWLPDGNPRRCNRAINIQ